MNLFCMFTSSKQLRTIPKQHFFNDKSVSKGKSIESALNPVPDCFDSPKGALAYKNISIMSKENNFVDIGIYANPTQLHKIINDFFSGSTLSEIQETNNELLNSFIESTVNEGYTKNHIQNVVCNQSRQSKFITQLYETFKSNTQQSKN